MAWVTEEFTAKGTTVYRTRWYGTDRRVNSKNFRTEAEAEVFKSEIEQLFPVQPRSGQRRTLTPLRIRIERSVEVDDNGCWLWTRKLSNVGYASMSVHVDGQNRTRSAHRVSYETFVGPIPDGLDLDHLCRVRKCVNPRHLEPVTRRENVYRSPIHKARFRAEGVCPQGHVIAEVGLYKNGNSTTCKACSLERSKAWHRRQATTKAAAR